MHPYYKLLKSVRTYLEFHGKNQFFITGNGKEYIVPEIQIHKSSEVLEDHIFKNKVEEKPDFSSNAKSDITNIDQLREKWKNCQRCPLGAGRNSFVFGEGQVPASLMFIGEGPGGEEDKQGIPFVGRAGQLLSKMIVAMDLTREEVFITNIVKCRPPDNRDPEPREVISCIPLLYEQIRLIQPKIIVALGRVSAQTLLSSGSSLTKLRGKWLDYNGIPLLATYHPAYLLRNTSIKKEAWNDLQLVMKKLEDLKLNGV
jgi:uracil-DNA glycosylase